MSSATKTSPTSDVAISSQNRNIFYSNLCQNAGSVLNTSVNSSLVSRSIEPLVPNYNSPNNVLINSSARPRTSNQVFASTSDLAAHYGIPTTLPPLPIPARRPEPVTTQPSPSTASPDYLSSLKSNYLSMLSQKPESSSTPSSLDMSNTTVSPADLQQPLAADFDLVGLFGMAQPSNGQDMSPFEPNDFLTSPWTPSLDAFGESPDETPLNEFLSTPLISDNNTFNDAFDLPLFGDSYLDAPLNDKAPESSTKAPSLDTANLLTMSPTSPALDPASLFSPPQPMDNSPYLPQQQSFPPSAPQTTTSQARRRTTATGTRKNLTPDSLVPLEAPTQPRRYLTPSATSRKELPAVFARKRTRHQMLEGEEDELEEAPLKPNATELEQIEWKRRQNTLAARKSRKRKLQHQQDLEYQVADLVAEKEKWKQRALTLQGVLQANGIPFSDFQD